MNANPAAEVAAPPASVVEGNTEFAFDLYQKLRAGQGNLFFSPYSLSTALAMTYAGARGSTAVEMAKTLHFTLPPEALHPGFQALINHFKTPEPPPTGQVTLVTANALWASKDHDFLPPFLDLTRDQYAAALRTLDFRGNPTAASKEINAWVEKQTRDKIRDLVSPSDLGPDTSLVLTNAIYFLGAWSSPFTKSQTTEEGVFHAAGGRDVKAPLMSRSGRYVHLDGGTFQLLEMPYAGGNVSMVVLLPKAVDGLPALEAQLDRANLSAWIGKASAGTQVFVTFPRFTLAESFRLGEVLQKLGMTSAFDPTRADFSGMDGRRDMFVSGVIHKAFVRVDEEGTEAAAATAVVMARMSAMAPSPPVPFRADHPFVVIIRERTTGSVLFLGRVNDPHPKS